MRYLHRQIEKKVIQLVKSFPSVAITGPRQSGKSTLLFNTLKGYKYITLDDPLTREQALSDPRFFLDSIGEKAIIDEIQLAPQILSYIKMNIDKSRDRKGMYVFTGSQQFAMIKNLGDSLAGRIALLDLLPFSVNEKKKGVNIKTTLDYFVHAALTGSYPELVVDASIDVNAWYGSYIQTYLERDIRSIYNIGNLRDFQRFMRLLAGRCAQILNLSEFAKDIGVSVPTIKNWISILEASRIVYLLPPYYNNLGKRITKSPKVYFTDIGLVCYLTGVRDKTHLLQGPMAGPLFENFCIQETLKVFFNLGRMPAIYYLRTSNNLEIDLLIEGTARSLMPVEIKLNKTPSMGMGSNIVRFREIFPSIDIQSGFIVSLSSQTISLRAGLTAVTFDDYILQITKAVSK
ncbi:MAG: ATP-binding protein [Nitrospirae bacterium]|nr:ATP-binding protein [Nitrospirota bacterium]